MSVVMYVTYEGPADARFDRTYWLDRHFPLVREAWGPHGMESLAGFFPEGGGAGVVAICPVTFRGEEAMRAALAAPETARVMDDLKNFTDLPSRQALAVPLGGG